MTFNCPDGGMDYIFGGSFCHWRPSGTWQALRPPSPRLWRDEPLVRDRLGIILRLRLAIGEKFLAKFCSPSPRPGSLSRAPGCCWKPRLRSQVGNRW